MSLCVTTLPDLAGEDGVPRSRRRPIAEHLPEGPRRGCVLVVSDYRPLNIGHAATLCRHGYTVYTAVTYTDVSRIFSKYDPGEMDLVVFPSLVHGWHHQEGERRPPDISPSTGSDWQIRNMTMIIDTVCTRQDRLPAILIAAELMICGWYRITADDLASAGLDYQTYSAGDPHAIVDFMR